jgi:hypothetical protein
VTSEEQREPAVGQAKSGTQTSQRPLYVVRPERFDVNELKPKIESIASSFAAYLTEWRGSSSSRHALMGPVARVLDLVRRGQADFGEIMGRALRMHEMAAPYLSPGGRQSLENAVRDLLDVIERCPLAARRRVLEQVEYHVYYVRRMADLRRRKANAEIFDAWCDFVKQKYGGDIAAVQRAWGDSKYQDFAKLPFPLRQRAKEDSPLGRDVKEFLEKHREAAEELEEAEEGGLEPTEAGELAGEDIAEGERP